MIDVRRWVLAEAWLANGLRLKWGAGYDHASPTWQPSNVSGGLRFRYCGWGEWEIEPERTRSTLGFGAWDAPSMPFDDMRHELAHWLVASSEQREKVNFGMGKDRTPDSDELERKAMEAERIMDAVIAAAARIGAIALGGRP